METGNRTAGMKAGSRVAGMESKNRVAGVEVGDKAGSRTIGSRLERKTGGGKESGRFFAVLCAAVLLFFFMAGCGKQVQTAGDVQDGREAAEAGTETFPAAENSPVAGKKVAYILNMASSEIFRLCADPWKRQKSWGCPAMYIFPAGTMPFSKIILLHVQRTGMTGCLCRTGEKIILIRFCRIYWEPIRI